MSMGINFFGGIAYALGASGNEQPWNKQKMPSSDQCKFEVDQFLFRETESHYSKDIKGIVFININLQLLYKNSYRGAKMISNFRGRRKSCFRRIK